MPRAAAENIFQLMSRSLRSRNYRLFFFGQIVSLNGTWLTRIAIAWLVYRLTHDAFMLGLVAFAGQIPAFILAPIAGVLVDRWNLHRVLVITQAMAMLQSAALAALTLGHWITLPWIFALYALQGVINAFDMPARQAFVVRMVDHREDLGNAIALNSSMVNAARLIGPAVGGVLIALVGEGPCFAIDAVSYIAVIVSLLLMHVAPRPAGRKPRHPVVELREGFGYAFGFGPIRAILLLLAAVSLVGMPYTVLMPVFAKQVFGGGSTTYGLLMAATGVGAVVGAMGLAARRSVLGLGKLIPIAAVGMGLCLVAFGFSNIFWLGMLLMVLAGYFRISQLAAGNTLLQTIVDDDKRGRVMSLMGMCFQGMMPLGSLLAGYLASPHRLGAPETVMLGGGCCVVCGLIFARSLPAIRREVHPIYIERGILPPVAAGLGATTALNRPPEA